MTTGASPGIALGPAAVTRDGPGVLVRADLTVNEAVSLDPATVSGVVLAFGSPHAHSLMLLRAKGIPAVIGTGPGVLQIADGALIAVDGSTGEFVVEPSDEVRRVFTARADELHRRRSGALARAVEPAHTRDGVAIAVGAPISATDDALTAATNGADFGFVRSEFLFLNRRDAPDVDEQYAVYHTIAELLDGRRVFVRTLDVGGDKPLSFVPSSPEMNPFLGVRGIRWALTHGELLADQLLALARVACDIPLSILFPMVATLDELFSARRMLDDAIRKAGEPLDLRVGMMVEVPAAALKADIFAHYVDFFSLGTNDLTQFTMAADRGNDAVSALGDPLDPAVLRLIAMTCKGAADRASVSICGELAGNPLATEALIGLGARSLSVPPRSVAEIKEAVRQSDTGAAQRFSEVLLHTDTARAVSTMLTTRERR